MFSYVIVQFLVALCLRYYRVAVICIILGALCTVLLLLHLVRCSYLCIIGIHWQGKGNEKGFILLFFLFQQEKKNSCNFHNHFAVFFLSEIFILCSRFSLVKILVGL